MAVKVYKSLQVLLWLPLVSHQSSDTNEGMFTSSADLQGLIQTETELVTRLQQYVAEEAARLARLRRLVTQYEQLRDTAATSGEKFVGNPLNSFLLIKKLTSDWKTLQTMLEGSAGERVVANLTQQRDSSGLKWPSDEDLNGAAVGLMRLQDTYRLDTDSLARGVLNGHHYGPTLSAHDCFELGRQAYNNGDYFHTTVWMDQAMKLFHEETEKSLSQSDILEYQAFSAYMSGNIRRALKLTNLMLRQEPDHPRGWGNKQYYEDTLAKKGATYIKKGEDGLGDADETVNILKERKKREEELGEERVHYEQLCRGEEFVSVAEKSKMMCRYNFGKHDFLRIGPLKEEEVFLSPRIVLFHNFLTNSEVDTIKSMATPRFKRATVQNYLTGELETANYRWVVDSENIFAARKYF